MSDFEYNKLIEEEAEIRKAKAQKILTWNSIGAGLIGIIPGVGLAVQKLVIQKNATKKICQIFGLDINIVLKEDSLTNKKLDKNIDIDKDIIIKEVNYNKKEIAVQSGKSIIPILSSPGNVTGTYTLISTNIVAECQKIIDKLYKYFKDNMKELSNSFQKAVEHLDERSKKDYNE